MRSQWPPAPPPALVLELLQRISRVIKARARCRAHARACTLTRAAPPQDYCGVLSEDSLRKNFILVYELLDENQDWTTSPGV